MTKLIQKIGVGLTTAALLSTGMATSVFAENTISGNGAGSVNSISVYNSCSSSVYQSNNLSVGTVANVSANTGGSQVSGNTGGDVTLDTGDATAGVSISVEGGSNSATAPDCCACQTESVNAIEGNGAGSVNTVKEKSHQRTSVKQKNKTSVSTVASVKAGSGKNKVKKNTGPGVVEVTTGDAVSGVEVDVTAPSNSL